MTLQYKSRVRSIQFNTSQLKTLHFIAKQYSNHPTPALGVLGKEHYCTNHNNAAHHNLSTTDYDTDQNINHTTWYLMISPNPSRILLRKGDTRRSSTYNYNRSDRNMTLWSSNPSTWNGTGERSLQNETNPNVMPSLHFMFRNGTEYYHISPYINHSIEKSAMHSFSSFFQTSWLFFHRYLAWSLCP